jgi:hypothetical protein
MERHGCLPHLTWRAWSPRNFRQVTFGGLDVVEAQKMEPIPAHEIICNNSVVHEWR